MADFSSTEIHQISTESAEQDRTAHTSAESAEQDQTARMCSLILLCTVRKNKIHDSERQDTI